MSRSSAVLVGWIAVVVGVGMTVLIGCQNTTVDTSRGSLDVENSTTPSSSEATSVDLAAAAPAPEPVHVVVTPQMVSPPQPAPPVAAPVPVRAVPATYSRQASRPAPVQPALVTVPARTVLVVELDKTLSSHASQVGESFLAHLTQDVAADGQIALPRGSIVHGRVTEAKPAKKVGGRARLSLEFYAIELANGREVPLEAVFAEAGKSATTKDAAIIGGSTLGGAVIGHAVNKGEGTAIGAIVGGLAGAAAAHETRAKPVVVNSGTVLTLETVQPVTVELGR